MSATASAPKRRTQAERREEAERAILEAATRLVAAKGLDDVTLADAGEAAGYSRGLPSHYFGSKAELLTAVAEYIGEWFMTNLRTGAKRRPGLNNLIAGIESYFDAGIRDPEKWRTLHTFLTGALHKPALTESVARLTRAAIKLIEADLRAGIANGEIRRSIDPAAYAVLILASVRGSITQWLIDPAHVDLRALRTAYIASVKRSLEPTEK
jgi:AcrR family transcriptional regulator